MNKIKTILALLVILLCLVSSASALTTLDFEGFPIEYIYDGVPPEPIDIGSYYSGVNFVGRAAIMDIESVWAGRWGWGYPPHSGTGALHSYHVGPVDIIFDTPANYVEGWFVFHSWTGYLQAYDSFDNLIDSDTLAPSSDLLTYAMMSVSRTGIKKVRITNEVNNYYWLGDDIAYGTENGSSVIPEPASLSLLGLGIVGLLLRRKKIR